MIGPLAINEVTPVSFSRTMHNPLGGYARMDIEYLPQEVQVVYGPRQYELTTMKLITDLIRRRIVEEGRYIIIYHSNIGLIEVEGLLEAYQGLTNLIYIIRNGEDHWIRVTKNWDLYFLQYKVNEEEMVLVSDDPDHLTVQVSYVELLPGLPLTTRILEFPPRFQDPFNDPQLFY